MKEKINKLSLILLISTFLFFFVGILFGQGEFLSGAFGFRWIIYIWLSVLFIFLIINRKFWPVFYLIVGAFLLTAIMNYCGCCAKPKEEAFWLYFILLGIYGVFSQQIEKDFFAEDKKTEDLMFQIQALLPKFVCLFLFLPYFLNTIYGCCCFCVVILWQIYICYKNKVNGFGRLLVWCLLGIMLCWFRYYVSTWSCSYDFEDDVAVEDTFGDSDNAFALRLYNHRTSVEDIIKDKKAKRDIREQERFLKILSDKCKKGTDQYDNPKGRAEERECLLTYYQKCLDYIGQISVDDTYTENNEENQQKIAQKLTERKLLTAQEIKMYCKVSIDEDGKEIGYIENCFAELWSRMEAECLAKVWATHVTPEVFLETTEKEIATSKKSVEQQREEARYKKNEEVKRQLQLEKEDFNEKAEKKKQFDKELQEEHDEFLEMINNLYDERIKSLEQNWQKLHPNETLAFKDHDTYEKINSLKIERNRLITEENKRWDIDSKISRLEQFYDAQINIEWFMAREKYVEKEGKKLSDEENQELKKDILRKHRKWTDEVERLKFRRKQAKKSADDGKTEIIWSDVPEIDFDNEVKLDRIERFKKHIEMMGLIPVLKMNLE